MPVFVYDQGIKTVHAGGLGGGGGQKITKFCPRSCWMIPLQKKGLLLFLQKSAPRPCSNGSDGVMQINMFSKNMFTFFNLLNASLNSEKTLTIYLIKQMSSTYIW